MSSTTLFQTNQRAKRHYMNRYIHITHRIKRRTCSTGQGRLNTAGFSFIICLMGFLPLASAQQDSAVALARPKIELIARPLKDSILLRWAPDNSLLWEEANRSGYVLERITLMRDGKILNAPVHKILTQTPMLPQPLNQWEIAVKSNKYAAIGGQALYGKTFDLKNKRVDLYSALIKVQERDTRFSFALFSADRSPEVAKLMGLWYTDSHVQNNEKYLYKIYLANSKSKADTGYVYTGTSEFQPLPKPLDLKTSFANRKVNISWNQKYFRQIYNAYMLERSDDGGKIFHSVNNEPLVNLTPSDKTDPELFYATDSLPENHKTYFYRVRGLSSFGETSEPSDAVSGAGHPDISFTPYITEKLSVDNKKVTLKWEFPSAKNGEIAGFKLARSSNPKNNFAYVAKNLSVETREFTDEHPLLTNYYVIAAFNSSGEETRSMPVLVQLIDSLPPDPPVQLKGFIDSTGKVTLCWKRNTEEDIYGYRIYRANYATEEYSQITTAPVTDTCFIDKISLKTLTKSIFYRLMAIDQKQNHSAFSQPLEIKRPDKTPPVQPLFTTALSSEEGVHLEWINSTSEDVKSYALYRSIPGSQQWKLIAAFEASDSVARYTDKQADSVNYCAYTLIAKDFDNNESQPATPVNGKKIDTGIRSGIDKIFTDINREKGSIQLAWKKPQGIIYRYLIYRSKGANELTLYKSVDGTSEIFTDTYLEANTRYQYRIKVVFVDGSQSGFSKLVDLNY